jgi:hypothetical protein
MTRLASTACGVNWYICSRVMPSSSSITSTCRFVPLPNVHVSWETRRGTWPWRANGASVVRVATSLPTCTANGRLSGCTQTSETLGPKIGASTHRVLVALLLAALLHQALVRPGSVTTRVCLVCQAHFSRISERMPASAATVIAAGISRAKFCSLVKCVLVRLARIGRKARACSMCTA